MPRRDLRQAQPATASAAACLHLAKMTKGVGESLDIFCFFFKPKKEEAAQQRAINNSNPMPRRDLRQPQPVAESAAACLYLAKMTKVWR